MVGEIFFPARNGEVIVCFAPARFFALKQHQIRHILVFSLSIKVRSLTSTVKSQPSGLRRPLLVAGTNA